MMIQKTNSKKNLKKSNGNVHVNDEIKIKDNSEIKGIKRKLTKKADNNESKKKKINKKNNSAEESNEVFEESTTNLSPKKGKKAKLVGTSVLKEDVHAGDSDDEQVKGISGFQEEEPDKNEDANHHNNVQIKKSVVCLACGDNGHQTANCSLLEGMEVVECCSKCLSPDHASDGCSEVQVYTRFGDCRNCQDPNHYSSNCENECKWCKNNTDGHIRKDCPMADLCRNCEESKHPSWACEKKCKYCYDNFDGHVRKDCPLGVSKFRERDLGRGSSRGGGFRGRSSRGGGFRGRGSSGGGGFRGRGSSRGGGFGGSSCFNCNEVGHMSRVCPKRGF